MHKRTISGAVFSNAVGDALIESFSGLSEFSPSYICGFDRWFISSDVVIGKYAQCPPLMIVDSDPVSHESLNTGATWG